MRSRYRLRDSRKPPAKGALADREGIMSTVETANALRWRTSARNGAVGRVSTCA